MLICALNLKAHIPSHTFWKMRESVFFRCQNCLLCKEMTVSSLGSYCRDAFIQIAQISITCFTYFGLIRNVLQCPPELLNFTGDITIATSSESENIDIYCESPYNQNVSWFYIPSNSNASLFGELVPLAGYQLDIENYDSYHILKILRGYHWNEGLYTCIYRKGDVFTDQSTRLHVKNVSKPMTTNRKIIGFINKNVTLMCSLLPNETEYSLTWKMNENVLNQSTTKYMVNQQNHTYFLTIFLLQIEDEGRYYCFNTKYPIFQKEIILYVRSYFADHQIENFIIAYNGENINVTCHCQENTTTELIRLSQITYHPQEMDSRFCSKNGTIVFHISNLRTELEGIIYCRMEENLPRSYTYLAVLEKIQLVKNLESNYSITTWETNSITMECRVYPTLGEFEFLWLKILEDGNKYIAHGNEIIWKDVGYNISSNNRLSYLRIVNAKPSHSGTYACVIADQHVDYIVSIKEIEKIEGMQYTKIIDLSSNENFECFHGENTDINMTWLHNDTKLEEQKGKYVILEEKHISILVLQNAEFSDSGRYTCCYDINNNFCSYRKVNDRSLSKDMIVKVSDIPTERPQLLEEEISVFEDEKAVFSCLVPELEKNEKLVWILPNSTILPCSSGVINKENFTIYSNLLNCTLEIDRLIAYNYLPDKTQAGIYECIIDPTDHKVMTVNLNIISQPKFSHEVLHLTAYLNYSFAVTGLVFNPDNSQVDLEMVQYSTFKRLFTQTLRKGKFARLTYNIPSVDKDDEGGYIFTLYPFRNYRVLFSRMIAVIKVEEPPILEANDTEVFLGQDVNVTCFVENHEGFNISWKRVLRKTNDLPLQTTIEYSLNFERLILILHYKNVPSSAGGHYQCEAKNENVMFSESITLTVLSPRIELKDVVTNQGDIAIVNCDVENLGVHEAELLLNEKKLDVRYIERYIYIKSENYRKTTLTLQISDVREDDGGTFTCWVTGVSLSVRKTAHLIVN